MRQGILVIATSDETGPFCPNFPSINAHEYWSIVVFFSGQYLHLFLEVDVVRLLAEGSPQKMESIQIDYDFS